jgi:hypothetical protein
VLANLYIQFEATNLDKYLGRERMFTGTFLFLVSLVVTHLTRNAWLVLCGGNCQIPSTPQKVTTAPEAYRIALPAVHRFLIQILHFYDGTYSVAITDFIGCFVALCILYYLTVEDLSVAVENTGARIVVLGLFLAFIQFPIAFIVYRQRFDTLPTAMYVAVALLCFAKAKLNPLWMVLLVFATAFQSFVRADTPFIVGIAVTILSLSGNVLREFGSRSANFLRGCCVVLISGGIQAYLKYVKYPGLPYSTGSPIVIMYNLKPHVLSVFLLALLPFLWLIFLVARRRRKMRALEATIIAASILYLPLWFTVGIISEVRIFVPFLLALCVFAARTSAVYLFADEVPVYSQIL